MAEREGHTSAETSDSRDASTVRLRLSDFAAFIPGARIEIVSREIPRAEAERILALTEIHATPFHGEQLTVEMIAQAGLFPAYETRFGSTIVRASLPYEIFAGRVGIMAYVQVGDGPIIARSYYASSSQALWRYLPRYLALRDTGIDWFGKGYKEQSITLPFVIQKFLSVVADGAAIVKPAQGQLLFAGTARGMNEGGDSTLGMQVRELPVRLRGSFYHPRAGEKVPSEDLRFEARADEVDFDYLLGSWTMNTSEYGLLICEAFPSRDRSLRFLFCRQQNGPHCFIGGIERCGNIGSTGLYEQWVDAGDLVTPGLEYPQQTGGYEDPDGGNERYVSMLSYTSKIPSVGRYRASLKKRGISV